MDDWFIFTICMNFERYIASRISNPTGKSFSGLIVKIAIAAIALSMMVMILTTNIITGFKNEISDKVFNFWGHIHIADGLSGDSFDLIPIRKDKELVDSLLRITSVSYVRPSSFENDQTNSVQQSNGGITHVEAFTVVPGIVADKTQFEGLLLKGLDQNYDVDRIQSFVKSGSFIDFSGEKGSRDMMISQYTARRMNFEVGQKVNVSFILDEVPTKRQFTITGIYNTGLEEYDRRFALVDMRVLQDLLGWAPDQVSGLEVFVEDLDDLPLINDFIYFELLPPATYSETVRTKFSEIFEWLELQNVNERVIIFLMILVALINMITALMIFVLERTRMIGVLKALGATNWSVRKIFLYNAGGIIIKGVLIGNGIAILLCLIQKYTGLLKLNEADYYLSQVPIEFNLWSMFLINSGTILVVLIFMLVPSLIITQITPVKTIQFK